MSKVTVRPRQKAAILCQALGPQACQAIFRRLTDEEIEQLTLEIANLGPVQPETEEGVLEDFATLGEAQSYVRVGGISAARQLLDQVLGPAKTAEILQRLTATLQVRPFDFIRRADPAQLLSFLEGEHPQTVALVMAYMSPEQAAQVLAALPPEMQVDVVRRIATMARTSPDVVKEVERVLERKLAALTSQGSTEIAGVQAVVQMLNRVDRSTERSIVENLGATDPELMEEIRQRMFVFEDLVFLDDRSLQRALREIDLNTDLPLAMRGASDEVKAKILRNLSQRAGQLLQENMEYLGPVRLREVEEAQQRIVAAVRRLEDAGEIVVSRGGRDEVLV